MRAVLTNFGTMGDVGPFLALAVELRAHGHEPLLALSPYYAPRVAQLQLPFTPIGPDLQQVQNEINIAMTTINNTAELMAQLRELCLPIAAALPQMFEELQVACSNADVLISGPSQPAARMVHDITGIPFVMTYLIYCGLGTYDLPSQQASDKFVNFIRQQYGLLPLRHPLTVVVGPMHDGNSPHLNLYAVSRHIVAPLADWSANHHITGYFFLDDTEWVPDPALVKFLDAGEPPVVIGLGSMTQANSESMTELVLEAIQLAGCRAVLLPGWRGMVREHLPNHVLLVDFVPYHWLFSRAACVVYHGATGTMAATFRAGVPTIIVPHTYEHPFNARMAHEIGIAGPPIEYTRLTARRLSKAIVTTLKSPTYREAGARISANIQAEQGVGTARTLIEALMP